MVDLRPGGLGGCFAVGKDVDLPPVIDVGHLRRIPVASAEREIVYTRAVAL
ncbi:hypothetical protein [Micromonospora olivasterospora]|uniref:hypothetical protein n=1 Tax=Micromonospora olivasterospora TaxID=1880 RepID=UPI001FE9CC65|nr:hypothetical protein [Micromonospora olivasterospora]